jgi:hypothetical protein
MGARGPVARSLIWLGLICGAFLALASSVLLHGFALVAVAVVAALVGCAAYGARDGNPAEGVETACQAAAATVGVIMLEAGVVVLVGGAVAALLSGVAIAVGGAVWGLRAWRARQAGAKAPGRASGGGDGGPAPMVLARRSDGSELPVSVVPTAVLGREWLETTMTLACRLEPAARQAIIRRRQETLDELERRDPAGFARWLTAAGAGEGSDPASFVRNGRARDTDAA